MSVIRVIDLETTGVEPTDKVVEIGASDLDTETGRVIQVMAVYVNPGIPIPVPAMAVHHITDYDVSRAKTFEEVWDHFAPKDYGSVVFDGKPIIGYAAHNRKFEAQWIKPEHLGGLPFLCSYKGALAAYPDAPGHSNQVLRYHLRPSGLLSEQAMPPHRALPDSYVSAFVLREVLHKIKFDDLVTISDQPPVLVTVSFGKHRGEKWMHLPSDYLDWIIVKSDMDDDDKWMAKRVLEHRRTYLQTALSVLKMAASPDDLVEWFKKETPERERVGILKGSIEYASLANACAAHKQDLLKSKPLPTTENNDVRLQERTGN